jgi:hypothetical protein
MFLFIGWRRIVFPSEDLSSKCQKESCENVRLCLAGGNKWLISIGSGREVSPCKKLWSEVSTRD